MAILPIAVVLLLVSDALCAINNNRSEYIIDVTPSCPPSPTVDAIFTLLADVPAYAHATCKGNYIYPFEPVGDGITFRLPVGFDGKSAHKRCVFHKKVESETFVVLIEVGWGEPGSYIMTHKEQYQVSCAYGKTATGSTQEKPVNDWMIAPREKMHMIGKASTSTFSLRVISIKGDPFFNKLPFGRWIQLEARSDGHSGEKGFRALSCIAINSVTSYAILRAGCGDGIVFARNSGFQTRGLRVFSPYFEGFKLKGSNALRFICNFTVCEHNCDGNSCPVEVKRSIQPPLSVIQIVGEPTDVSHDPELELIADLMIPPPVTPVISVGQTVIVEQPVQPLLKDTSKKPIVVLWLIAVLLAAIVLLIFSTLLQICVNVKTVASLGIPTSSEIDLPAKIARESNVSPP